MGRYWFVFIIMVKSAKAAQRVMASLTRFVEGHLKLVVNRAKRQAAPLKQCAFLGFQIGTRGKAGWTASILQRVLTNRRLHEQGVPDMRTLCIVLHYGAQARL